MSIKNQVEAIIFLGGDENKIKDLAKFFKISICKNLASFFT